MSRESESFTVRKLLVLPFLQPFSKLSKKYWLTIVFNCSISESIAISKPLFLVGHHPPCKKQIDEFCRFLCLCGNYFKIVALVEGSTIVNAIGTLCLQFPGWRTVFESFVAGRRYCILFMYIVQKTPRNFTPCF